MRKRLKDIENSIDYLQGQKNADAIVLSGFNLDKTKTELEIAQINVKSNDFIFSHLTYFQDSAITRRMLNLDSVRQRYEYSLIPNEESTVRQRLNELDRLTFEARDNYDNGLTTSTFCYLVLPTLQLLPMVTLFPITLS